MKIKKARKLGFIAAISMLIGSIIGSGIYFKNNDVFVANNYSSIGTGIAWILASVISLTAAISFSEIGRTKTMGHETGITFWIKKYLPKQLKGISSAFFTIFYYSLYALVLGYLSSKFFFEAISIYKPINPGPLVHLAVGTLLNLLLLILHYINRKTMSIIQIISVIVKTIPIIAIVLFGFILFNDHHIIYDKDHNVIAKENLFTNNRKPSLDGIVLGIPMILFAYDAFTSAATVQNKIKNGDKKLPLLIIITMLIVITLYVSLTIVQMLRGTGTMRDTIYNTFDSSIAKPLSFVLLLLITVSVLGALNGFIYMFRNNIENIMNDGNMFVFKWMSKDNKKNATLYSFSFILSMSILSLIYSLIIKGDFSKSGTLILVLSDTLPILAFFIYAIVILFYWIKRSKTEHNKINGVGFYIVS
ncbi:MAG: amino acid permease, partial [Mycoplasmataceae bacterium]|nr:amino acid permease [Mycoplasmataceae bacterium]